MAQKHSALQQDTKRSSEGTRSNGDGKCVTGTTVTLFVCLTLNIPSPARQRCLSSWGPRRTPWFFFSFVISPLFDAVDYSNYVFWNSETIIQ